MIVIIFYKINKLKALTYLKLYKKKKDCIKMIIGELKFIHNYRI